MTLSGFDTAQARYDGATPREVPEVTDDPGTKCLGSYPKTATDDAYQCDARGVCPACDGVVCTEHDDVAGCGDGPTHEQCHRHGCYSAACAEEARDDAVLARAGM